MVEIKFDDYKEETTTMVKYIHRGCTYNIGKDERGFFAIEESVKVNSEVVIETNSTKHVFCSPTKQKTIQLIREKLDREYYEQKGWSNGIATLLAMNVPMDVIMKCQYEANRRGYAL